MKIRYFVIAILLLLTVCAFAAQQAKVIHLKAADQTEAKKLWADLQAAQKAWNEFNAKVEKEYVKAAKSDFGNGFEFSEDFSVIVPKQPRGVLYMDGAIWPKGYSVTPSARTYPFTYNDGCNTTTCTMPGVCSTTAVACGSVPYKESVVK